jgi:hypothetical protein
MRNLDTVGGQEKTAALAPVGPLAPRRGGVPRPDMPDPAG